MLPEDRSYIRTKAMAVLLNAARTHHAVIRWTDASKDPQDFHRLVGGSVELADPDVIPPVGGWFQDNGVPMFVEWRAVDDTGHEWPLYPGGAGDLARSLA